MALSGIAWGWYSLLGRVADSPALATASTFLRAAPAALVLLLFVYARGSSQASAQGLLLAILSGALTSGLGYILWYAALKGLSATRAAIVQLSVPVIAALGGVLFVGEQLTVRLAISATAILGGVALALSGRHPLAR
jgi:drug/metabolite transporter (DMT)-like permease